MIDQKETLLQLKTDTTSLSDSSLTEVIVICEKCSLSYKLAYSYALRKIKKHNDTQTAFSCAKCGHSHRKNKATPRPAQNVATFFPPEIDEEETEKTFGYYPKDLSPWSRKEIVVRCFITGQIHLVKRCSLNRNKSVIETGHYISRGGIMSQRRKEIISSEETRSKMKASQKNRRKREKGSVSSRELTATTTSPELIAS